VDSMTLADLSSVCVATLGLGALCTYHRLL
jgi:hypothetical protein